MKLGHKNGAVKKCLHTWVPGKYPESYNSIHKEEEV